MKPKRLRPHDWSAFRHWTVVCARCEVPKTDEADMTSCISDAEAAERVAYREAVDAVWRVWRRR